MAMTHVNPKVLDVPQREIGLRQYSDGTMVAYDKETGANLAFVTGVEMQQKLDDVFRFTVSFIQNGHIKLVDYPFFGSFPAESAKVAKDTEVMPV